MDLLGKLKKQLHTHNPSQWKREALWLLDSMKQHAPSILMVALLGFAGTAMGLLSSVASKYLIDAVTGFGSTLLLRSAAALVIFTLGSLMLQALSSRVGARVHIRVKNSLQQKTYGKILRSGWEALEPFRSGDLLNRLTADVSTVSEGIINFLPGLLSSGVKFAGAFGIMLFYDPVMALIALLGVPVTLVLSRALLGQLRRHNLQMKDLTGEVLSFQEDSFRNLTSIKSFSITDRFEEEMGRLQSRYADAYLSFNAFQIKTSSAMAVLSMLVSMCCFGWGVYQLWAGNITYGSMTMFLQLAGTLRGAFSSLVSLGQQAISLTTSAGRIMTVEDLPEEEMTVPEGLLREERLDICLRNVSFEYQNAETVLRSFDFDASHGDSIALTGPSGEGKTTLLRLLLGLVQSCSGTMELVGGSGRRYPIHPGTRPAFAYVPQGNSVFAGTIAQNLRLAAPDATTEQMLEALKIACAWDFVNQFPDGLDHTLGAGGRGISEGQAQRLAIARALLRRAPILLLDEATSGLDPATEQALLNNLRECGFVSTCILVTHRSASAAFCGRAYEISQGTVTKLEK